MNRRRPSRFTFRAARRILHVIWLLTLALIAVSIAVLWPAYRRYQHQAIRDSLYLQLVLEAVPKETDLTPPVTLFATDLSSEPDPHSAELALRDHVVGKVSLCYDPSRVYMWRLVCPVRLETRASVMPWAAQSDLELHGAPTHGMKCECAHGTDAGSIAPVRQTPLLLESGEKQSSRIDFSPCFYQLIRDGAPDHTLTLFVSCTAELYNLPGSSPETASKFLLRSNTVNYTFRNWAGKMEGGK